MIVWTGRGFLIVVVLLLSLFLCSQALPTNMSTYSFAIACIIAGAFSWFMGKKWNTEGERTVIDKESGQEIVLKPNHSLFWIPMQYWGFILGAFALIFLFQAIF